MINIKDMNQMVSELTDNELRQAVVECNSFDADGAFDLDSVLINLTKERFKSYYSRYVEITVNHIYKEAANRFLKGDLQRD